MNKETLQSIVDDLRAGRTPRLSPEDFPCFSAEALEGKSVKITAKAGLNGKLFGAVTAKEVAQEIKMQFGLEIDKRKINLSGDIKAFGVYPAEIKLYAGITAKLSVAVTEV